MCVIPELKPFFGVAIVYVRTTFLGSIFTDFFTIVFFFLRWNMHPKGNAVIKEWIYDNSVAIIGSCVAITLAKSKVCILRELFFGLDKACISYKTVLAFLRRRFAKCAKYRKKYSANIILTRWKLPGWHFFESMASRSTYLVCIHVCSLLGFELYL